MANEDQFMILKQGIKVGNQWREEHPDEKIDLSKAPWTGHPWKGHSWKRRTWKR